MTRAKAALICFIFSLLGQASYATNDERNITEDPFEHYAAALQRIKQFLPNAQFNGVKSKRLGNGFSFCSGPRWQFTFLDKIHREVGEVLVYNRDESLPGGPITCKLALDVEISTFSPPESWEIFTTSEDPLKSMKIDFAEAKRLAEEALGSGFHIKYVKMEYQFSDDLLLELNDNENLSADINMTTGEISTFDFGTLPDEYFLPPAPIAPTPEPVRPLPVNT